MTMPLFESYKWRRRRTRYLFFFVVSLLAFPRLVVSGAIRQRYHEDLKDEKDNKLQNINFLDWVEDTLNINTELVTIENFEYLDYIQAMKDGVDIFYDEEIQYYQSFIRGTDGFDYGDGYYYDDDEDYFDEEDEEDEDQFLSVTDYPTITTRGLAASRDIVVGEVILKVPHDALWTVSNTIDKDPILSKVMGTDIRRKYGWNSTMDEIPLLAVALLYHYQLRNDRNIHDNAESEPLDEYDDDVILSSMLQDSVSYAPYLKLMQDTNLAERIPHLWDSKTLRQAATIGVRRVAKGIQKDVKELYERIMLPLIQDYPDVFGNPYYKQKPPKDLMELSDQQKIQHPSDGAKELEWMFSLEKFRWAFALVNSRHWQLPIPEEGYGDTDNADAFHASSNMQFDESASPPASMPTDEWMDLQKEVDYLRDEDKNVGEESIELTMGNSFLAPVADLMNFGPPCTRGLYNTTTHTFDILATCNISKGQEITFWYGDACQDEFMANYGFTLPMMVPTCQFQDTGNIQNQAIELEKELLFTLEELDQMDLEIAHLVNVLKQCKCEISDRRKSEEKSAGENGAGNKKGISPLPPDARIESNKSRRRSKKSNKSINARHAIRGANNSNKGQRLVSEGLTLSQKRRGRRQEEESSRDL